jgi:predicted nucleic acid-binding protein
MVAIDTSILVSAHRTETDGHERAKAAIERAAANPAGWIIPSACVAEFWATVTSVSGGGQPSSPEEARAFLEALAEAGAVVATPRPGMHERLLRVAVESEVTGRRIFDLEITLTAYEAGAIEIWSLDRRFASHPQLPAREPA